MKVGIYISGLGQSFVNESVEKYAERFKNELNFHHKGTEYLLKTEKINYITACDSTVVSIYEKGAPDQVLYKFYDFKYHKILTEKFNKHSLIFKNLWLFGLVIRKLPIILKRLFFPESYNKPYQTFYVFGIFLIIAFAILFMIPAMLEVITNYIDKSTETNFLIDLKNLLISDIPWVTKEDFHTFSKITISFTAVLLLVVPNANVLITSLATEFVCANDYMQHGSQRQLIQGNLEHLIEYVSENEKDCKIHFHTYSFGSVLAIDYIYPFGNKTSKNAAAYCEAIITIGTPFEFIKSYYPQFYQNRRMELGDKLHWLNVYSIADALATNFRNDAKVGDAEFGIEKTSTKPTNLNYEVIPTKGNILDFLMLYSVRVHGMYWDNKTEGQSCLRHIHDEMHNKNLL